MISQIIHVCAYQTGSLCDIISVNVEADPPGMISVINLCKQTKRPSPVFEVRRLISTSRWHKGRKEKKGLQSTNPAEIWSRATWGLEIGGCFALVAGG